MQRAATVLVLVGIATATPGAEAPPGRYNSPHNELSYRYSVVSGQDGSEHWQFAIASKSGDLSLSVSSDPLGIEITSDLVHGTFREALTYTVPVGAGVGELAIAWPNDRVSVRFADHGEAGKLAHVDGPLPDCERLGEGELQRTRQSLLKLARADYFTQAEAPRHLKMLVAGLEWATWAPSLAGDCEMAPRPAGGNCYASHGGFNECLQCCELEAGIEAFVCHAASLTMCTTAVCRRFADMLCGGMAVFSASVCTTHNCRGKIGDPGCNQNQPCEGTCMYFCGPGRDSACGTCAGQDVFHQECCF
jgi:hypothetical protein